MSVFVFAGPYWLATPRKVGIHLNEKICSKNRDHQAYTGDQFCRQCGNKIITKKAKTKVTFSLGCILNETLEVACNEYGISPADYEFINQNFRHWDGMDVGGDKLSGMDVIAFAESSHRDFDAHFSGPVDLLPKDLKVTKEMTRDINILAKIMGYQDIKGKVGLFSCE